MRNTCTPFPSMQVADVLRQAEAGRGRLTSRTSLARAIAAADVDGDGTLSAQVREPCVCLCVAGGQEAAVQDS